MMQLFPITEVVQGQPLQLIARAEGDGVVGHKIVDLEPGDDFWGVTYDDAVQQLTATGVVTIPDKPTTAPAQ